VYPRGKVKPVKHAQAPVLVAMVNAMNTVRPKLQDFYASLNDDQEAKFNIMAPPPNAPAQKGKSSGQ
jgi:hypothetical protein